MNKEKSLFEKIGGMQAVQKAVDVFYTKVLNDEFVSHFFANTDMKQQTSKQKAFLAYAFGARLAYTGAKMKDAHKHMDITNNHFNAVAKHLTTTLHELEVPQELINEVEVIIESTRRDIVKS